LPDAGPAEVIEAAAVDEYADLIREAETVCPTNAIHVDDGERDRGDHVR
jgi:ferredoxin